MTDEERIKRCFQKNPGWPDGRRAMALKVPVALIRKVGAAMGALKSVAPRKVGRTLDQFRQQHDVRERIRRGIKEHLSSVYMLDQEFREACGVAPQDWRRFADLDEFDPYRWRYRGTLHWGQPRILEAMRETVGAV